jgi:predicted metalloprotease
MRMDDQDESQNVEDERGSSGGGFQFRPLHGIGLGGIAVVLVCGWIFGLSPLQVLSLLSGSAPPGNSSAPAAPSPADDAQKRFVSRILRSTEQVWGDYFAQQGKTYSDPKLLLYRDSYPTACGQGQAAAGPFYCPHDHIVYLDMSFFDLMRRQLGAPGQFAQAYVIGHEVGHHVQNLLGIIDRVDRARERSSEADANALSVRLELQADCLAGVWATRSQQEHGWRLDSGDIETALHAASQIGDDTLQRRAQGTVVPETFTHGTSAQRVAWFRRGVDSGDPQRCDTFNARPM